MLKTIITFSLMLLTGSALAEPIQDVDKFQKRIEQCVKGKSPDKCLNNLLPDYLPPGNEAMAKQLPKVVNLLVQWLGDSSVYAIHPIKSKKVGDIANIKIYAIESSSTGFMVLQVKYLKILGKPYLFGFNLSSTEETINALLSGNL